MSVRMIEDRVSWGTNGLVAAIVQDRGDGRVLMLGWMDPEALAATFTTGLVNFHSRSRNRLWRKGETSGNVLRLVDLAVDCDGDALLLLVDPVGPTCHRGTRSCFDVPGDADELEAASTPEFLLPTAAPRGPLNAAPAPAPQQAPVVDPGPPAPAAAPPVAPAPPALDAQPPAAAPAAVAPASVPAPPAAPPNAFAWLETLWATIGSRVHADPATSYTARLLAAGVDGPARKVAEEATEVLMAAKDDAVAAPAAREGTRDALAGEVADLLYHTLVLLRERGLEPETVIGRLRERHQA